MGKWIYLQSKGKNEKFRNARGYSVAITHLQWTNFGVWFVWWNSIQSCEFGSFLSISGTNLKVRIAKQTIFICRPYCYVLHSNQREYPVPSFTENWNKCKPLETRWKPLVWHVMTAQLIREGELYADSGRSRSELRCALCSLKNRISFRCWNVPPLDSDLSIDPGKKTLIAYFPSQTSAVSGN